MEAPSRTHGRPLALFPAPVQVQENRDGTEYATLPVPVTPLGSPRDLGAGIKDQIREQKMLLVLLWLRKSQGS